MAYVPRGKIVPFIEAMKDDPHRMWSIAEIAKVMGLPSRKIGGSLIYAAKNGLVFRGMRDGLTVFRGVPFEVGALPAPQPRKKLGRIKPAAGWVTTEDDIRVPKVVPGWRPPVMVCPRRSQDEASTRSSTSPRG